jgi:D-alanyl-D-alanine carboxypeptidase (penicillin-binding protein 5/6)
VRLAAAALALVASTAFATPASAADGPPKDLPAAAWVLVDAGDDEVLAAHRSRESRSIASTTKLMTAYVARERLRLDETVVAPGYEALAAESLLGLEPGERIKVRDLLLGLLLVSGNDAANALAQAAAGSVDRFVAEMNDAAERLGLDDTSYANPIGLDQQGNYSSARDLVELAIELREDPLFREIFDTASTTTETGARPRNLVNRNDLVQTVPFVNGVKTGYTLDAGNVLVASGKQGGVELVSAVLGAPSEPDRDAATMALLNYGFSLYHRRTPVKEGETIARVAITDRDVDVALEAADDVRITVRKGQEVDTRVDAPAELAGPVDRGQRLGVVVVTVDGEAVGRTALVAATSASSASLVERYDAIVPGPRALAWALAIGGLTLIFIGGVALWDRRR